MLLRVFGVLVAVAASVATPAAAGASEGAAPTELPTVGCSWSLVTLGVEQYCINVYGEGLYVDRVSGELEKVSSQASPVEGAEVNLQGTLADGGAYDKTAVAENGISSATAWFEPRVDFKDGSDLCIRVRVGAVPYSKPTCVTIHA
ncbi:MAG: hypothetical protein ACRDQ0_09465 [Pseudonocardia sp.]